MHLSILVIPIRTWIISYGTGLPFQRGKWGIEPHLLLNVFTMIVYDTGSFLA